MKLQAQSLKLQALLLVTSSLLLVTILGCEAFVRKFTRKPKNENLPQEEMVIAPEVYQNPQMTKEDLYRQYFLYWKSWQDELIESLSGSTNHKRQIGCINEAIKNLYELRPLLNEAKQKGLDVYINQLIDLQGLIAVDFYGNSVTGNRLTAEHIKRNILQDFSYSKIKDNLL